MNPRETLEFVTRHTAHKSMKYISSVAGTDAGNLHGCLSGKRALPFQMAQRVAAAVGLKATQVGNQLELGLTPHTVINLEVNGSELSMLVDALQSLAAKQVFLWRLLLAHEEVPAGGVSAVAIALVARTYFVINLAWDDVASAVAGIDGVRAMLPGVWLSQGPDDFTYSTASEGWIRLRAGVESIHTLDVLFLRDTEPSIDDWARMLIDLNRLGAHPNVVARTMTGMVAAENKKLRAQSDNQAAV